MQHVTSRCDRESIPAYLEKLQRAQLALLPPPRFRSDAGALAARKWSADLANVARAQAANRQRRRRGEGRQRKSRGAWAIMNGFGRLRGRGLIRLQERQNGKRPGCGGCPFRAVISVSLARRDDFCPARFRRRPKKPDSPAKDAGNLRWRVRLLWLSAVGRAVVPKIHFNGSRLPNLAGSRTIWWVAGKRINCPKAWRRGGPT